MMSLWLSLKRRWADFKDLCVLFCLKNSRLGGSAKLK